MEYSCLTTSSGFTFPGLVNGASLARIQRYRLGKRPQMSILNPSRRLRREIPSRTSAESLNESRLPASITIPFLNPWLRWLLVRILSQNVRKLQTHPIHSRTTAGA